MGLICPNCSTSGGLKVKAALELPRDARSDEIAVQVLKCRDCGFIGVSVYEESRRGGLDDESVDHYGYHLESNEWKRLYQFIRACPHPREASCQCNSHQLLGGHNNAGRWNGLDSFNLGNYFTLGYQR